MPDTGVETVFELTYKMNPREGSVTVHDEAFSRDDAALLGTAFTNTGVECLQASLDERIKLL